MDALLQLMDRGEIFVALGSLQHHQIAVTERQ